MAEIVHITDENRDIIDYKLYMNDKIISNNLTKKALIAMKNKIFSYLNDSEKKLMYLAYADCLSSEKISIELNITPQTVRHRLKKLNKRIDKIIESMMSGYRQKLVPDEILIYEYFYLYNFSIKQLADKLNVDRKDVSNKLNIINLKMQQDKLSESKSEN